MVGVSFAKFGTCRIWLSGLGYLHVAENIFTHRDWVRCFFFLRTNLAIQYLAHGEVLEVLDDSGQVLDSIVGESAIGQMFESDFERVAGLA